MKIGRRILWAALVGGLAGFAAQVGFYLCLFNPVFASAGDVFSLLAFWSLMILSLFFPDGMPDWGEWPVLNIIGLMGWVFVAVIAMLAFHFLSRCAKDRIANGAGRCRCQ